MDYADEDIVDVLTIHNDVMRSDLFKSKEGRRFPSHVWLQLRGELYGLMIEKRDGTKM